ncbi:MAG: glutamate-5-semialdehyde dehydrogenase, partial [Thermodesulfobacteriota bacterium]
YHELYYYVNCCVAAYLNHFLHQTFIISARNFTSFKVKKVAYEYVVLILCQYYLSLHQYVIDNSIPMLTMIDVRLIAKAAKDTSRKIQGISTERKNSVLRRMKRLIIDNKKGILEANEKDIAKARKGRIPENLISRLVFNERKIDERLLSLEKIIRLPDPVGQIEDMEKRPNGLIMGRMRVPLGVILMIYEARPHVTVNAGAFALKSGNAIILKGGSEAKACNSLLGNLWQKALVEEGLPEKIIQSVSLSHEEVSALLNLNEYIDVVIPRGGKELIMSIIEESRIPVIKHFEGICHVYIDKSADIEKAKDIVLDSKLLAPSVCNAMETLLISDALSKYVPELVKAFTKHGVEVRGCQRVHSLATDTLLTNEEDWGTEYLDKIISIRMVRDIDEAIHHINRYGSNHTDAIVTEDYTRAHRFLSEVDSGVVLVNASTMFNDGEELGMGAEIGISTDKLHARGPMGLKELTTYKLIILGQGHTKGCDARGDSIPFR